MMFRDVRQLAEGNRLYRYYNEEEYELLTVLSIDDEYQGVIAVNEETLEAVWLSKHDIDVNYYLILPNYTLGVYRIYNRHDNTMSYCTSNTITSAVSQNNIMMLVDWYWFLSSYWLLTRKVFHCILDSYISKNSNHRYGIPNVNMSDPKFNKPTQEQLDELFKEYLFKSDFIEMPFNKIYLYENYKEHNLQLTDIANNKDVKLSNGFFMEIEDDLGTIIDSYKVILYDPSIDILNIKHKYFVMYSWEEDCYALFIYRPNDRKYISQYLDADLYFEVEEFMDRA